MKRSIKILLFLVCIIMLPNTLSASRITLQDEYDYLEELKEEKRKQETEKQMTEAEFNRVTDEIYQIGVDIERLNKEIKEAEEEIEKSEKEINIKKTEIDNILVFLQLSNGEKAYLEYIFEAKSFTDFIHRISIVEQISKYNKELIGILNDLIVQNNNLKKRNAENIKEQEAKKAEMKVKLASLGSKIDEIDAEGADLESQIEEQEKMIAFYEDNGCKRSDKTSTCVDQIPTATGFLRPLEKGVVTSEYYWRISPITGKLETHSGIDLGNSSPAEGTPIFPVAHGRIIAKIYRSSCGGNMLYIAHNINGKEYTSVYMHMLSFNESFKIGDIVKVSDQIGQMGGWSTSTSHGGYDGCTTGAHLHLTLATGHTTNHRASMFNPRDKIYFPNGFWYSRSW